MTESAGVVEGKPRGQTGTAPVPAHPLGEGEESVERAAPEVGHAVLNATGSFVEISLGLQVEAQPGPHRAPPDQLLGETQWGVNRSIWNQANQIAREYRAKPVDPNRGSAGRDELG